MLVELLLIYNIILSFHQPSEGDWIGTQSKPERTLRGQKEIPPFVDEMMCVLLKLSSLCKSQVISNNIALSFMVVKVNLP